MTTFVTIVFALAMILFGAELFTNAIEWLGKKLKLGVGAVGSVLAAIGTALPETAVPVTAILFGTSHDSEEVGIGGILGAPFLLATLGCLVLAIAIFSFRRKNRIQLQFSRPAFQRDMTFFLVAYAIAGITGFFSAPWLHRVAPIVLILIYLLFLRTTLRERSGEEDYRNLHRLYLQLKSVEPKMFFVVVQLSIALTLVMLGAHMLTQSVEHLSTMLRLPTFVVSALLVPLVTELPETLNSVVWIRDGKDSLAVGNITGAMVLQSTVVPAIGIWMTDWHLTREAILTSVLTLLAAFITASVCRVQNGLRVWVLLVASSFYWILPMHSLAVGFNRSEFYLLFGAVVLVILGMAARSAWTD